MILPIYQVDAFANGAFTGNPAAVIPLDEWIPDHLMQSIALENNLSETAFFVPDGEVYQLRWFTPLVEVDLCGHATLATAFVLFDQLNYKGSEISFSTRSGILNVSRKEGQIVMDFPTDTLEEVAVDPAITKALGAKPKAMYRGKTDWMCIYENQSQIENMKPDFGALAKSGGRGVLVTSPGNGAFDFVSRGFFPQSGVDEDPATGSAHTSLTSYWSSQLQKNKLEACQLSARKGFFNCEDHGDRVIISGEGRLYLQGEITV